MQHWKFYIVAVTGVALLLATLLLIVWLSTAEPYYRQRQALELAEKVDFNPVTWSPVRGFWTELFGCSALLEVHIASYDEMEQTVLDETDIRRLMALPFLERISFYRVAFAEEEMRQFLARGKFERLYFFTTNLNDGMIRDFQPSPEMCMLMLGRTSITEPALAEWLGKCPNLVYLTLTPDESSNYGTETFQAIADLKQLRSLIIHGLNDGFRIENKTLEPLAQSSSLKSINLKGVSIRGESLAVLLQTSSLSLLSLEDCDLADIDLEKMGSCSSLSLLNLSGTKITDAGLEILANHCPSLTHLFLSRTRITDKGLEQLKSLPLYNVDISETGVTDAGIDLLERIPTLRFLAVERTKATPERIGEFHRKRR